jgi:hypothetical protein
MTAPALDQGALTRDERDLLARVHRWARQPLPSPYGYLLRWERDTLPGMWRRNTTPAAPETAEVWWGPATGGSLRVVARESHYGETILDATVALRDVREAVDLLVAWGILPLELSSAYTAGLKAAAPAAPCWVDLGERR